MRGFVSGVLAWRIYGEELGEEFGLCNRYSAVEVVSEVESEEAGCVADILDDAVYVGQGIAENEGVIHVHDDVSSFGRGDTIE